MTPYSAAAGGSFSSRASSRLAAFNASSGSSISSSRPRSSLISACSASPSPSSSWIAFSCCRRKNSRWPFSISDWTCDWIFVPSSKTSSSRFRITESSRSRAVTSAISRSRCFSSVLIRIVVRVAHGHERDDAVGGDDVLHELHGPVLADRERAHRLREDDGLLERQDGEDVRDLGAFDRLGDEVAHELLRTSIGTFVGAG